MAPLLCRTAAVTSLALASCGLPLDPDETSERIASTHELRVGISDNPPWTIASGAGEPAGIEPELIRRFAASVGAHVKWTRGSETKLAQALKNGELDVVAAGLDKKTQWSSRAGVTQPFAKDADGKKHVLLAAPGENGFVLTLDRFLAAQMQASAGGS